MRLPTSTLRATLAGLQVTMTRPATAWALCATGLFAGALPAMGQSACFTIVSDTTTSIHVIGNTPALWGNEVAFYGTWPAALLDGIYTVPADLSAPFKLMVNQNDLVPNETYMTYFHSLQNAAVRDGAVTFTGGNTTDADGLYWSDGETIVTLVDAHGGFPSPYPRPSMGASGVAFVGKAGFEVPWFVEYVNPTPAKVYSNGGAAPGGGTFIKTEPGIPAMGNHHMAFTALCSKPGGTAGGAYTWNSLTNQISLVANWNTTMPGTASSKFDAMFDCDTDDARIVFTGKSGFIGFGGRVGIFVAPLGSTTVSKIAIDGDLAPNGGTMTSFGSPAVEGDLVAYVGSLGSPLSPTGAALVAQFNGSAPFEVIRTGGLVNGRQVLSFDFNHRALSGHRLAFRAQLADPGSPTGASYALVVADIDPTGAPCPVPPAPGSNDPPAPLSNCASWSTPPAPDAPFGLTVRGMKVIADDDIWMVGGGGFASRFDGSTWTVVPTPPANGFAVHFEGVDARATDHVWACGNYVSNGNNVLAAARWNGAVWTNVPMPQPPPGRYASDVAVRGVDDVYVCGYSADATQFLLLHWNGTAWSEVALPEPTATINRQLWTVKSLPSGDVLAAGAILPNGNDWEAVIYRFNGRTWSKVVDVPQPESSPIIYDMCVVNESDIWVAGDMFVADAGHQTMTMHFDGTTWTHVPSPAPGAGWNFLFGIAASDANHVVACGYHYYGAVNEPIAMVWNPITGTWKGYDMPMPGYSTAAWAAGALSDGTLLVAGGIGYYDSTPADIYLEQFGRDGGVADLNCDGAVDSADLAILLGAWGQVSPTADLDADGEVGAADLSVMLGAWS